MLLGDDLAGQLLLVPFLLFEEVVTPRLEPGKTLLDAAGLATVDPDGAPGEVGEKAPVVADQHQRRTQRFELVFQPFDGRQVEVVGRLVQQQDIGLGRQHASQRGAARLPARQRSRIFGAHQTELFEQILRPVGIVRTFKPRFDISERGREARQIGLLRQIADRSARLEESLTRIRFDGARRDLEKGGFSRPVAADQCDLVARRDGKLGPFQQRGAAHDEADRLQGEKRRGHLYPTLGGKMPGRDVAQHAAPRKGLQADCAIPRASALISSRAQTGRWSEPSRARSDSWTPEAVTSMSRVVMILSKLSTGRIE